MRTDLNRRSRAPEARGFPGYPTHRNQSAQRESNPHIRHGKAVGCRYIMGASNRWSNCQRTKSTGWDSNPRHRITGAGSLPLDDQCFFHSVGPEGLEPSPTWLRARHAAANTLIPSFGCSAFCARTGRGGNRTLDLVLIRDPLSPLSYAPPDQWGRRELNPHLAA